MHAVGLGWGIQERPTGNLIIQYIQGYYSSVKVTFMNHRICTAILRTAFKKKYKLTYQAIPCTLIGRLAIDSSLQGKRLGEFLLFDSLKRSYDVSKTIASLTSLQFTKPHFKTSL